MTFDVPTYTLEEWRAEATRRGNGDMLDCRMVCPLCRNVATPRQFKEVGADPELAAVQCIGRIIGARGGLRVKLRGREPMPQPCDWTAGGLFGTLADGVFVVLPDGREVNVFAFAD